MKRRELLKHLATHGCVLKREGSRHSIFQNLSNGKLSTVPRHPDVKELLALKICKDLEIPPPGK